MSTSVLIMGTLISKLPLPIFDEAIIRLLIDRKNLEENLIAIEIDKNKSDETITRYINTNEILIPVCLFKTV
tara:strand:- start:28 stop:243 length:216 start_codon:yes stop_codon:yes gene_type:complete